MAEKARIQESCGRRFTLLCFVLCASTDVIGYYSLSAGAISHEAVAKIMRWAVNVAADAGVFAILVHALSDHAKQFYLSHGFVE